MNLLFLKILLPLNHEAINLEAIIYSLWNVLLFESDIKNIVEDDKIILNKRSP